MKKKKDVWVKISDGLYENQTKLRKKKPKKRKRNPFVIGSDARQWRGIFGLKKWLMK